MELKYGWNLSLILMLCLTVMQPSEACPKTKQRPSRLYENYMIGSLYRSSRPNGPDGPTRQRTEDNLILQKLQRSLLKAVQESYPLYPFPYYIPKNVL